MFTRFVIVTDIVKDNNNNPSIELKNMVSLMIRSYGQAIKERDRLMTQILDKARSEGINNEQIKQMILNEMREAGISDRTIYRVLPDELKNKIKQKAGRIKPNYVHDPEPEPLTIQQKEIKQEPRKDDIIIESNISQIKYQYDAYRSRLSVYRCVLSKI